jgi:hypothetical protein
MTEGNVAVGVGACGGGRTGAEALRILAAWGAPQNSDGTAQQHHSQADAADYDCLFGQK